MSRGFGQVQHEIMALLESDPWGAWTTTELCQRIYRVQNVEKRHRVAVSRALRGQIYPSPGWGSMRGREGEAIVFNAYHAEGVLRAFWKAKFPDMPFDEFRKLDVAKRIAVNVLFDHADKNMFADLELDRAMNEAAEDLRLAEKAKDPHRMEIVKKRLSKLDEARRRSSVRYVSVTELRAREDPSDPIQSEWARKSFKWKLLEEVYRTKDPAER